MWEYHQPHSVYYIITVTHCIVFIVIRGSYLICLFVIIISILCLVHNILILHRWELVELLLQPLLARMEPNLVLEILSICCTSQVEDLWIGKEQNFLHIFIQQTLSLSSTEVLIERQWHHFSKASFLPPF